MRYLQTTQDSCLMFEMMTLPFAMVYHHVSNYLPEEVLPLLQAIINQTWRIMEEEKLLPQEWMLSAFEYTSSALASFR